MAEKRPWRWEEQQGCEEPAQTAVAYWQGLPLMRCPAQLIEPWAWDYLYWFKSWERGRSLVALEAGREPARLVDAMTVIDAAIADLQAENREKDPPSGGGGGGGRTPAAPVKPSTGPRASRRRRR